MAAGLYLAALRETLEECGLLLGDRIDPEALREAETRLRAGEGFVPTLTALGLPLQTARLAPWSRWITPRVPSVTRSRFDTRFFLAEAPADQDARHDDHEATETLWVLPATGLRQYWEGAIDLAPPQIMSLCQLARFNSVAALMAAARSRRPPLVEPEAFDVDGERVICYPGDPRHSVPSAPGPAPRAWPTETAGSSRRVAWPICCHRPDARCSCLWSNRRPPYAGMGLKSFEFQFFSAFGSASERWRIAARPRSG
jgi:8-oxo-dGTP pyrophosphatase MutT (NUDIX family)